MAGPFLFIGDSLIEYFNWQARFADRKILNYGIAGETAEGLLARLPSITGQVESPGMVMIMTGINNVAMEDYGFLSTYEKIIAHLQQSYEETEIVVCSLLPADLFFLAEAVPRVNKRVRDIALNNGVIYLDLYPLYLDENTRIKSACFEPDGVHLSRTGYEVWAGALDQNILPLLPR